MNSAWSLQKTQILSRNSSAGVSKSITVITALQFCAIIILFRERDHSQLTHAGERTLRAFRSGRWHRLAISLGLFVLLLLPFDRAARINGLGRLCLAEPRPAAVRPRLPP